MSILTVHDIQGLSAYSNKVRIPSGHALEIQSGAKFKLPGYDQANRPSSAEVGELIINTTTLNVEVWTGDAWYPIGGGQSTLGTEVNPAVNAKELRDAGITEDGPYWIKASTSAPLQQVYCILNPAVDGGGWMVISNNAAKGIIVSSGHIPRPTAYAGHVGTNGWNSYDSNFNFSINAMDMQFDDFYHVGTTFASNNFDPGNWFSYIGHRMSSTVQIPTDQATWGFDNEGIGLTRGTVNSGIGLGNRRLGYGTTSGNYSNLDSTSYGFGVLGTTKITAEGGGNSNLTLAGGSGQYYPTFSEWWRMNSTSYVLSTFSWSDYQNTSTGAYQGVGWDDWQDGSGMGDQWYVEGQSQNFGRGRPSFVMIR